MPKTPRKTTPSRKKVAGNTSTSSESPRGFIWFDEEQPFTAEHAKRYLGWTVVNEGRFTLKDLDGNKILCKNNLSNRPLVLSNMKRLKQEIAHRNWQLNGEPFIIGVDGSVLEGQHTMIALILLSQEWERDHGSVPMWDEMPYIHKVLVKGISEADKVVNTINTGKPRSFADVVFRSHYLADLNPNQRRKVCSIVEHCVNNLWERTGAKHRDEAHIINYKTHAERLDFLDRHESILRCCRVIGECNEENRVSVLGIRPGVAAAFMFLMATASTEPAAYAANRHEEALDFSLYEKAEDFWIMLTDANKRMKPLRDVLATVNYTAGPAVVQGAIIKAWNLFSEEHPLTMEAIQVKTRLVDGKVVAAETPTCGGIDTGGVVELEEVPSVTEQEKVKASIKAKRAADMWAVKKPKRSHHEDAEVTGDPQVGSPVWVVSKATRTEFWKGKLQAINGETAVVQVAQGFQGAGTKQTIYLRDWELATSQPVPT